MSACILHHLHAFIIIPFYLFPWLLIFTICYSAPVLVYILGTLLGVPQLEYRLRIPFPSFPSVPFASASEIRTLCKDEGAAPEAEAESFPCSHYGHRIR